MTIRILGFSRSIAKREMKIPKRPKRVTLELQAGHNGAGERVRRTCLPHR